MDALYESEHLGGDAEQSPDGAGPRKGSVPNR